MSGACEAAVTKDFVQRAASVDTLVALRTVCAAELALLSGAVVASVPPLCQRLAGRREVAL